MLREMLVFVWTCGLILLVTGLVQLALLRWFPGAGNWDHSGGTPWERGFRRSAPYFLWVGLVLLASSSIVLVLG